MAVSVDRIRVDVERIGGCTSTPGNGATRPTFSDAWGEARRYVISEAAAVGCDVQVDAAGNVHARPAGLGWDARAWLVGSHIDSVPHGGDYDGVAGVVVGLELLRSATEEGLAALPVELIVFAEEEGPTFGLGMLGSRAWVGEMSAEKLATLKNADGKNYLEAGQAYGVDGEMMDVGRIDPRRYFGFIELHIEQGPGMWRRGQRLGVVSAIAGRRQYQVTIRGEANHAGATSMGDRRDALVGAAEAIVAIEAMGRALGAGVVLTVGRMMNYPNAVNVVPDRVEFTIDFRAGDDRILTAQHEKLVETIEAIGKERALGVEVRLTETIPARPMDRRLIEALNRIAGDVPVTVSGALHDAAVIAPFVPTVMLFVPSRDGISHNPAEFSRVEDIAAGCAVIEKLVRRPTVVGINAMDREKFVGAFGGIFEHSSWIAERAWERRPFGAVEALHAAMCGIVAEASADEKMGLIRAHPDLVGRLAQEGRLTRESTSEQAAAGLTQLSAEEIEAFERNNAAYRDKFGFPFVICARQNKKEAILAAFPARLKNSREEEIGTALEEIYKIARLRLDDLVWE